jgi:aldose 1-epimerase
VVEHGPDHLALEYRLHPQPGYPFSLELRVDYRLGDDGLHVLTTATNIGSSRCPFGSGAHPYLRVVGARVDELLLSLPGRTALRVDDRGIPVDRYPTEGTPRDFRSAHAIGALKLDDAYADLERDVDGRAWARLSDRDGGHGIALWVDEAYRFLMVFSGDTLPDGGRHSLAVEPMTCAPNAFVSGDGLLVLEPGASFEGSWGIVPDPSS